MGVRTAMRYSTQQKVTTSPLITFLKTAAPGRRYVTLEHHDRHVQSYAHRLGVTVNTSRVTIVSGTHAAPVAESAVIVTIIGRSDGLQSSPPPEHAILTLEGGFQVPITRSGDGYVCDWLQAPPAQPAERVPEGWCVSACTSSTPRDGDKWEVYDPSGSGGVVSDFDICDPMVRKLLDALAAAPSPARGDGGEVDDEPPTCPICDQMKLSVRCSACGYEDTRP